MQAEPLTTNPPEERVRSYLQRVDRALDELLPAVDQPPCTLHEAMRYSVLGAGKRMRPLLCYAAAESVLLTADRVDSAACAVEFIHAYSLIHDDLPAMDDDDLRRGRPTCHRAFNEATAILAGDALLTLTFQTLSSVAANSDQQAAKWLRVIQLISHAAGYCGMIQGQMLDIGAEGNQLTLNELQSMHRLKTGALIEVSLICGAELADVNSSQLNLLESYAQNIGLAFQVTDDILNVEGDPAIMGKAVGTDELRQKSTYPSLLGLEESKTFAGNLIGDALHALGSFDQKAEPLRAIATYIIDRKK